MNILILSRYSVLGASSRVRMFQYIEYLEEAGFSVTVAPFFDDKYLTEFYKSGRRSVVSVASAYWSRTKHVLLSSGCDAIWVEKELFPFLPGVFEQLVRVRRVPIVVDYDDAIFHNYDLHRHPLARLMLSNKLDPLLRVASAVTVGNEYLAAYAADHGAARVLRVPTVIDLRRYEVAGSRVGGPLRLGWIGSPATCHYLGIIRSALERVAKTTPIELVTIGAGPLDLGSTPVEEHTWSEETEAAVLSSLDVGVMPLDDSPWEQGKCGYKLIQYMAVGRPLIASPVGVNKEIVSDDVGYLATNEDDWVTSILNLAGDPGLRARMGANARADVAERYSIQKFGPEIAALFSELTSG